MGTSTRLQALAWPGGYVLLYVIADVSAIRHVIDGVTVVPWHAGPALGLALLVRRGLGALPAIPVAFLLAAVLEGGLLNEPALVLARATAETLTCATGFVLLERFAAAPESAVPRGFLDVSGLRGVFTLFIAVAGAAAFAALAAMVLAVVGPVGLVTAAAIAGHLFFGTAVALLCLVPIATLSPRDFSWRRLRAAWSVETALQAVALAAIAWEVFGRFANAEIHFFYVLFLPFAWIVTRQGQRGTVLALAAIYLAPVISDGFAAHRTDSILELQVRLAVLAATSLLLGAMVSERQHAQGCMLARQTELAHFQRLNVGWEMASALAHELNQPLTAAMNYTQAAARFLKAPTPDLDQAHRVLAKSIDQIERVGHIIHGLRDFMRKGELRLARVDLGNIVPDAVLLVSAEANAAGVSLVCGSLAGLPAVLADKTQIVQVLVNLIRNAVQALAATEASSGLVMVAAAVADGAVVVTVADNGPGLSAEVAARLFEPFMTTRQAGMGLGLSISKSILEAHDGWLWVDGAGDGGQGTGAKFHFSLPVAGEGEDGREG